MFRFIAVLTLSAATPVLAQTPNLPDRPITRAEVVAAAKRQFAAMDANHDGVISQAEFKAYRAKTADAATSDPFGRVGSHWFERADANSDGRVTLAEAEVRPTQLFDTADLNHDGVISAQERKMAMMLLALHTK